MKKPYIDYTFTGIKTFTNIMDEAMVSYRVFSPEKSSFLFKKAADFIDRDRDSLELGSCTRGGQELYYLQIGMKITKSYMSHIVFIYDHNPSEEELIDTVKDLLSLTEKRLDSVQEEIGPALIEEAQKKSQCN